MKKCDGCGASNEDKAKFCQECGRAFAGASSPSATVSKTVESAAPKTTGVTLNLAASLMTRAQQLDQKRKADILFVLDCTGSMGGEIEGIKETISEFADLIASEGVRVRVGLVAFRDRLIREDHRVLTFGGEVFTQNPKLFREQVSKLSASGGGDAPESSLDALMLALNQPFDTSGNKVIVLITDAPPHIPDLETQSMEQLVAKIQAVGIQQCYLVIRTQDPQSQVYLKLLEGVRGMAFDLGTGDDFRKRADNFKRTLRALGKTISETV